jgi:hypothetical protein
MVCYLNYVEEVLVQESDEKQLEMQQSEPRQRSRSRSRSRSSSSLRPDGDATSSGDNNNNSNSNSNNKLDKNASSLSDGNIMRPDSCGMRTPSCSSSINHSPSVALQQVHVEWTVDFITTAARNLRFRRLFCIPHNESLICGMCCRGHCAVYWCC